MKVYLAKNAGFCMGVRRAINICAGLVQRHKKEGVYTFGPLIHNKNVIHELESIGASCISGFENLPDDGVTLIRSHGLSPLDRKKLKESGLSVVDATCPKVARVQGIIKKHVTDGFYILIHGDHGHAEVNGLLGYAASDGQVIANMDELNEFLGDPSNYKNRKFCVVAQTTQEPKLFGEFAKKIIKFSPESVIINTICDATENRQKDLREIPDNINKIIIVGGKHSANTTRLSQLAKDAVSNRECRVFHVETPEEIDLSSFSNDDNVLVSAGASTPQWLIEDVIDKIKRKKKTLFSSDLIVNILWALLFAGCFFYDISLIIAPFLLFSLSTFTRIHYLKSIDKVHLGKLNFITHPMISIGITFVFAAALIYINLIPITFSVLFIYNLFILLYFRFKKGTGKSSVITLLNLNVVLTFFMLLLNL